MAGGPEALRVLEELGMYGPSLNAAARGLRPDSWPASRPGGGKGVAHVWAPNMAALACGISANPQSAAREAVAALYPCTVAMISYPKTLYGTKPEALFAKLSQLEDSSVNTLGEALEYLIDWLSEMTRDERALWLGHFENEFWSLRLSPFLNPKAVISYWRAEDDSGQIEYRHLPQANALVEIAKPRPMIDAQHSFDLPFSYFIAAAELVADSRWHRDNLFHSLARRQASGGNDENGGSPAKGEEGGSSAKPQPKTENGAEATPAREATTPSNTGIQPPASNGVSRVHTGKTREGASNAQSPLAPVRLDTSSPPHGSRRDRQKVSTHDRHP